MVALLKGELTELFRWVATATAPHAVPPPPPCFSSSRPFHPCRTPVTCGSAAVKNDLLSSSAPCVTLSFLSSFLRHVSPLFSSSSPSLRLPSGQLRVFTGRFPRFSPTHFLPNCQRLPRQPGHIYGCRLRGNRPLPLSPPAAALASFVEALPPLSSSFPVSPGQVIIAGNPLSSGI